MDNLKKILSELIELGCCGIKISFEDEGALLTEHITMAILTNSMGIDLSIKIGGCEAKRDIVDCKILHATSIVAPMIESKFALKKFIDSCNQYNVLQKKGFNLETITAYNNINELAEYFNEIDYVTFGRVDFAGSMQKDRNFVNSDEIFYYVSNTFKIAKLQNKKCYLGGAISIESEKFINNLIEDKIIDNFETRYVIFDAKKVTNLKKCLYLANVFEVEWMKYIRETYLFSANKDLKRIEMIESRISNNN